MHEYLFRLERHLRHLRQVVLDIIQAMGDARVTRHSSYYYRRFTVALA